MTFPLHEELGWFERMAGPGTRRVSEDIKTECRTKLKALADHYGARAERFSQGGMVDVFVPVGDGGVNGVGIKLARGVWLRVHFWRDLMTIQITRIAVSHGYAVAYLKSKVVPNA
jgi:hypothetical protein